MREREIQRWSERYRDGVREIQRVSERYREGVRDTEMEWEIQRWSERYREIEGRERARKIEAKIERLNETMTKM